MSEKKVAIDSRSMFIIWKWKDEFLDQGFYGTWSVEGSEKETIYCVNQDRNREWKDWLVQTAVKSLAETSEHKCFIFIHTNQTNYSEEDGDALVAAIREVHAAAKITFFLFKDVNGPLYLDYSDYGILGKDGDFSSGERDARSYPENQEKRIIKYIHFNRTWIFYEHDFRRKCLKLYEDFFIATFHYPDRLQHENDLPPTIYRFLDYYDNQDLLLRMESFLQISENSDSDNDGKEPFAKAISDINYYGKEVLESYESLKDSLEKLLELPVNNRKYETELLQTRSQFVDLIELLL